ncbi:MAG: hypothetical protein QXS74_03335 [Nitrososphaeria archaeon]
MKYYIGPLVALILSFPLLAPTFFVKSNLLNSTAVFVIMCLIFIIAGIIYDFSLSFFKKQLTVFKKFALFSGIFWLIALVPIKYVHNNILSIFLVYPYTNITSTYVIVYAFSGFIFGIMYSIVYRYISAFVYS